MRLSHGWWPAAIMVSLVGASVSPCAARRLRRRLAAAMLSSARHAATARAAQAESIYVVVAGTKVLLRRCNAVNTKSAKPGDGVYLTSTFPVVDGNPVMIPAGVYVQGVVDRVARAGRIRGRA